MQNSLNYLTPALSETSSHFPRVSKDTILSAFRSFFGRSYGSTVWFRDLLTFSNAGRQNQSEPIFLRSLDTIRFLGQENISVAQKPCSLIYLIK